MLDGAPPPRFTGGRKLVAAKRTVIANTPSVDLKPLMSSFLAIDNFVKDAV
jgi:hypothetical protein